MRLSEHEARELWTKNAGVLWSTQLSPEQATILRWLRTGPRTVKQIGFHLIRSHSYTHKLCSDLETRGYLRRKKLEGTQAKVYELRGYDETE